MALDIKGVVNPSAIKTKNESKNPVIAAVQQEERKYDVDVTEWLNKVVHENESKDEEASLLKNIFPKPGDPAINGKSAPKPKGRGRPKKNTPSSESKASAKNSNDKVPRLISKYNTLISGLKHRLEPGKYQPIPLNAANVSEDFLNGLIGQVQVDLAAGTPIKMIQTFIVGFMGAIEACLPPLVDRLAQNGVIEPKLRNAVDLTGLAMDTEMACHQDPELSDIITELGIIHSDLFPQSVYSRLVFSLISIIKYKAVHNKATAFANNIPDDF